MRLLNLWPANDGSRVIESPSKRLIKEIVLGLLLLALLLAGLYGYFWWRAQEAKQVNAQLSSHLATLQKVEHNNISEVQMGAYLEWRNKHVGQLNWIMLLPQLANEQAQLTQVIQKESGLVLSGRADTVTDAQAMIARVTQMFPQSNMVSLESKTEAGLTKWVFVVQANDALAQIGK